MTIPKSFQTWDLWPSQLNHSLPAAVCPTKKGWVDSRNNAHAHRMILYSKMAAAAFSAMVSSKSHNLFYRLILSTCSRGCNWILSLTLTADETLCGWGCFVSFHHDICWGLSHCLSLRSDAILVDSDFFVLITTSCFYFPFSLFFVLNDCLLSFALFCLPFVTSAQSMVLNRGVQSSKTI